VGGLIDGEGDRVGIAGERKDGLEGAVLEAESTVGMVEEGGEADGLGG
jgi:hypothetical protein